MSLLCLSLFLDPSGHKQLRGGGQRHGRGQWRGQDTATPRGAAQTETFARQFISEFRLFTLKVLYQLFVLLQYNGHVQKYKHVYFLGLFNLNMGGGGWMIEIHKIYPCVVQYQFTHSCIWWIAEVDLRQRMRGTSRRNSGDKPTNGEKALRRSGSGDLRRQGYIFYS